MADPDRPTRPLALLALLAVCIAGRAIPAPGLTHELGWYDASLTASILGSASGLLLVAAGAGAWLRLPRRAVLGVLLALTAAWAWHRTGVIEGASLAADPGLRFELIFVAGQIAANTLLYWLADRIDSPLGSGLMIVYACTTVPLALLVLVENGLYPAWIETRQEAVYLAFLFGVAALLVVRQPAWPVRFGPWTARGPLDLVMAPFAAAKAGQWAGETLVSKGEPSGLWAAGVCAAFVALVVWRRGGTWSARMAAGTGVLAAVVGALFGFGLLERPLRWSTPWLAGTGTGTIVVQCANAADYDVVAARAGELLPWRWLRRREGKLVVHYALVGDAKWLAHTLVDPATFEVDAVDAPGVDPDAALVPLEGDAAPRVRVGAPVLTDADVAGAWAVVRPPRAAAVSLALGPRGKQALGTYTTAHVGGRLALVYDGRVRSEPRIRDPITGGRTSIAMAQGPGGSREARALAVDLDTGPLAGTCAVLH